MVTNVPGVLAEELGVANELGVVAEEPGLLMSWGWLQRSRG